MPAGELIREALDRVTPGSEQARKLHRGLRQLDDFASPELAAKSARAVSEAILTARSVTGRRDRVQLPSRA